MSVTESEGNNSYRKYLLAKAKQPEEKKTLRGTTCQFSVIQEHHKKEIQSLKVHEMWI